MYQEAIASKPLVAKRRRKLKMSPRSPVIATTKRVIMPRTVPRQKTSYSLGNFHIGNYKHGG